MKYRTIETQIPWKYKWKAIDDDGNKHVYTKKPKEGKYWWSWTGGLVLHIGQGPKPKDWTKTLVKL